MKVVTAAEMREIDRISIEELGIPGEVLMAYAGRAALNILCEKASGTEPVAVIAGAGNNGGDGFVIAWLLYSMKREVVCWFLGNEDKLTPSARIYYSVCKSLGVEVKAITDESIREMNFAGSGIIVDALFGTGFSGLPRGLAGEVIDRINAAGKTVCAIDIPSGLPADGAAPAGSAVRASFTVTMGLPKISLVTFPGKDYAGEVITVDIGFPPHLTAGDNLSADLIDEETVAKLLLPPEKEDVSKVDSGHLLLIGGFDGMEGAIMMSARAALETGVGLATVLTTRAARQIIAGRIPEVMTLPLPAEAGNAEPNSDIIRALLTGRRYDALVIGPGMGRSAFAGNFFRALLDELPRTDIKRVVIDGDGLFFLAQFLQESSLPGKIDFFITPHFGEAARILGNDAAEIKQDRFAAAKELARRSSAVSVLKGPSSIITSAERGGSEQCGINTSGCPAMATAGSGDVLAGIMGALLLRREDSFLTAAAATWLHGRAGERAVAAGKVRLKATDIIDCINCTNERQG